MKLNVATAETPLLARKDGAAPAKTRRLAHILIACALAIATIVGSLYVHGGAPLPFARPASERGSDVDVSGGVQLLGDERVGAAMNGSLFDYDFAADAAPSTPLSRVSTDDEESLDDEDEDEGQISIQASLRGSSDPVAALGDSCKDYKVRGCLLHKKSWKKCSWHKMAYYDNGKCQTCYADHRKVSDTKCERCGDKKVSGCLLHKKSQCGALLYDNGRCQTCYTDHRKVSDFKCERCAGDKKVSGCLLHDKSQCGPLYYDNGKCLTCNVGYDKVSDTYCKKCGDVKISNCFLHDKSWCGGILYDNGKCLTCNFGYDLKRENGKVICKKQAPVQDGLNLNCDGGKKEISVAFNSKTIYDAAKVPNSVFGVNVRDNLKFNFQHSFGAEWICDPLEELNKIVDQANSVKASVESMIERMGSLGEEIFETIFNFDQLKATLQNTVSDLLGSFGAGAAASLGDDADDHVKFDDDLVRAIVRSKLRGEPLSEADAAKLARVHAIKPPRLGTGEARLGTGECTVFDAAPDNPDDVQVNYNSLQATYNTSRPGNAFTINMANDLYANEIKKATFIAYVEKKTGKTVLQEDERITKLLNDEKKASEEAKKTLEEKNKQCQDDYKKEVDDINSQIKALIDEDGLDSDKFNDRLEILRDQEKDAKARFDEQISSNEMREVERKTQFAREVMTTRKLAQIEKKAEAKHKDALDAKAAAKKKAAAKADAAAKAEKEAQAAADAAKRKADTAAAIAKETQDATLKVTAEENAARATAEYEDAIAAKTNAAAATAQAEMDKSDAVNEEAEAVSKHLSNIRAMENSPEKLDLEKILKQLEEAKRVRRLLEKVEDEDPKKKPLKEQLREAEAEATKLYKRTVRSMPERVVDKIVDRIKDESKKVVDSVEKNKRLRKVRARKEFQTVRKKLKGAFKPSGYDMPWPMKLANEPYAPPEYRPPTLTFSVCRGWQGAERRAAATLGERKADATLNDDATLGGDSAFGITFSADLPMKIFQLLKKNFMGLLEGLMAELKPIFDAISDAIKKIVKFASETFGSSASLGLGEDPAPSVPTGELLRSHHVVRTHLDSFEERLSHGVIGIIRTLNDDLYHGANHRNTANLSGTDCDFKCIISRGLFVEMPFELVITGDFGVKTKAVRSFNNGDLFEVYPPFKKKLDKMIAKMTADIYVTFPWPFPVGIKFSFKPSFSMPSYFYANVQTELNLGFEARIPTGISSKYIKPKGTFNMVNNGDGQSLEMEAHAQIGLLAEIEEAFFGICLPGMCVGAHGMASFGIFGGLDIFQAVHVDRTQCVRPGYPSTLSTHFTDYDYDQSTKKKCSVSEGYTGGVGVYFLVPVPITQADIRMKSTIDIGFVDDFIIKHFKIPPIVPYEDDPDTAIDESAYSFMRIDGTCTHSGNASILVPVCETNASLGSTESESDDINGEVDNEASTMSGSLTFEDAQDIISNILPDNETIDFSHAFDSAYGLIPSQVFTDRTSLKAAVDACLAQDAVNGCADMKWWDVSAVTDMKHLFKDKYDFNGDISRWDVGKVTNMAGMFGAAKKFNQDISRWDVGAVTNMNWMLGDTDRFNQDISGWNVAAVTSMGSMFEKARKFNADISKWDVSKVTNMRKMFGGASTFNQDISGWNVAAVTDMSYMFEWAKRFNQDISRWNLNPDVGVRGMFKHTTSMEEENKCYPAPT